MVLVDVDSNTLSGAALNWVVAKCEGYSDLEIWHTGAITTSLPNGITITHSYDSFNKAAPIIEREGISTRKHSGSGRWYAMSMADSGDNSMVRWVEFTPHGGERFGAYSYQVHKRRQRFDGETMLEAAMRCFVATRLGEKVAVPAELLEQTPAHDTATVAKDEA